ncbi:hypothetical protein ACQE3E_15385 [Methylomonas sp. MED-D]|uniref:hypothetical protein n=1 Tax=Methylomonas sp. MED-D TaxID=3418768 RepID=UPI003D06DDC3
MCYEYIQHLTQRINAACGGDKINSLLEYEYAVSKNKPLFACVVTEEALDKMVKERGRKVLEENEPSSLKSFRSLVLSKMVKFFDDTKDIKIAIGDTMSRFAHRDDLTGWVRPTTEVDVGALASEISRLSKENSELRVHQDKNLNEPIIAGLLYSDLKELLERTDLIITLKEIDKLPPESSFITLENINKDDATKLVKYGIAHNNGLSYAINEEGRRFLNKFELDQLRIEGNY